MAFTISDSVTRLPKEIPTPLTFDQILDKIAELQVERSALDKEIKALKAPAKAELNARGRGSYTTPSGTNANLSESNRTNADRKEALRRSHDDDCGITPDDYSEIFKINTVEVFKVK